MYKIDKIGLYERDTIKKDIPVSKFKNYEYTEEDFLKINYNKRFPVLYVESFYGKINLKNNILNINNKEIDCSFLTIKDFYDILINEKVDVQPLTNHLNCLNLPLFLMCDFTNTLVKTIEGEISPLNLKNYSQSNKTIFSVNKNIDSVHIYNEGKPVSWVTKDDHIFYEPTKTTKIYLKEVDNSFYIFADMLKKEINNSSQAINLREQVI